jgi:hypothetical protein
MKLNRLGLVALATLIFGLTLPASRAAVITKDYGSGPDTTYLLLQFAGSVDSVLYTYHFTYNAASHFTGAALFLALDSADAQLNLTSFGTPSENFYVDQVAYDGYSEPTGNEDGTFYWNYFVSGGLQQDVDPNTFQLIPNQFTAAPDGVWSGASVGGSNRIVEPGSWDAWVFGEYDENFNYIGAQPGVAPVPEPSPLAMLTIGGLALGLFLRRRRHA